MFVKRLPPMQSLVFFEAAARHQSFTKAAAELCVSQSAVSKQIKQLERFLGVEIFYRSALGLEVSQEGIELLKDAQAALGLIANAADRVRENNNTHEFTIVATVAVAHYWLFPRIALFKTQFPDIDIHIYSTDSIDETVCMQHDMAILYGDGHWTAPLTSHHMFDEVIYAVCGSEYPISGDVSPEGLLEEQLIHLERSRWRWTCWDEWFKHFGIDYDVPAGSLIFNNLPLVLHAASNNLGIALGWDFAVREDLKRGVLKQASSVALESGWADYLVYNSLRRLNPAAECFRDWLLSMSDEMTGFTIRR